MKKFYIQMKNIYIFNILAVFVLMSCNFESYANGLSSLNTEQKVISHITSLNSICQENNLIDYIPLYDDTHFDVKTKTKLLHLDEYANSNLYSLDAPAHSPLSSAITASSDSDNDGVADANDKCPFSLPGVPVNIEGCPDTDGDSIADNIDSDDDGDGINDNLDKCPHTPLGANVNANGCPDTDGDTVYDDIDIDDDNDGVLDTDEEYLVELNMIQDQLGRFDPSSDIPDDKTSIGPGCPNNGSTSFNHNGFATFNDVKGSFYWKTNVYTPTVAGRGMYVYVQANVVNDSPKWPKDIRCVVSLEGSTDIYEFGKGSGVTYAKLFVETPPVGSSIELTATVTITEDNCNFAPEIFFSVMGASEVIPVDYYASLFLDTDGDGISNHLDLDSDGDGCPDSVEAGITPSKLKNANFPDGKDLTLTPFINGQVSGTVGANGLANSIETDDTQNAKYNYSSSYITNAIVPSIIACDNLDLDSDNDNIADVFDIDDDNDGVLDINETSFSFDKSKIKMYSDLDNEDIDKLIDDQYDNIYDVAAADITGKSIFQFNFTDKPVILTELEFVVNNGMSFLIDESTYHVQALIGVKWVDISGMRKSNGKAMFNKEIVSFPNNNILASKYRLFGVSGKTTTTPSIQEINFKGRGQGVDIDTDKDNIVNRLDLDSDDDGCSDSVEANNTIISENDIVNHNTGDDVNKNGLLDIF